VIAACGPANFTDQVRVAAFTAGPGWNEPTEIIKISFQAVGVSGDAGLQFSRAIAGGLALGIDRAALVTNGSVIVGTPVVTCQGVPVTINMREGDSGRGTNGPDVILGTGGRDIIRGRGGDDIICAGGGDDLVLGGSGNDVIQGGGGGDYVFGGADNDDLRGGQDDDVLRGGRGDDIVRGGQGADLVSGGRGDDDLRGNAGSDVVVAGRGTDELRGGADIDRCRVSGRSDTVFSCEEIRGARR